MGGCNSPALTPGALTPTLSPPLTAPPFIFTTGALCSCCHPICTTEGLRLRRLRSSGPAHSLWLALGREGDHHPALGLGQLHRLDLQGICRAFGGVAVD